MPVDGDALAAHDPERLMHGADAVRAEHDPVERVAARHLDVHRAVGIDHHLGRSALRCRRHVAFTERGEDRDDLGPAGCPERRAGRRPGDIDLFDLPLGRDRSDHRGDPRRPHHSHDTASADVGPDGERRALRPEPDGVFACVQRADGSAVPIGEFARCGADGGRRLAAERSTVGQRAHRLATRPAPCGVGFEVGGLHPGGLQRAVPPAGGKLDGPVERDRGAAPLHLAGGDARLVHRLARRPRAVGGEHGDKGVGRRGVVGEAGFAEGHRGGDVLGRTPLDGGPATGGIQITPGVLGDRSDGRRRHQQRRLAHGLPPRAPA